jgi:ketosteroid isomerase-like protein
MEPALERDLMSLENRYWQAVKDRDVEGAMRLTADPCIVAGAQGVARVDLKDFAGIMDKSKYTLHDFELSEPKVEQLGDDVAILAYRVHEELTVDGKRMSIDCSDASAWIRRDGHWLCALHTESLKGDPYGRDRRR